MVFRRWVFCWAFKNLFFFFNFQDDYRAWDIQKSELCKPEQSYHPRTVKFGNSTTFQDDYVPQEIKPRQSFKPSSNVKSSSAPFHGDTSHRLDYIPHQLEVKFARPKEVYKPTSQPFERSHNSSVWLSGSCGWNCKNLQAGRYQSDPKCPVWRKHGILCKFSAVGNPATQSQESTGVRPSRRGHAVTQHEPSWLRSASGQVCRSNQASFS